MFRTIKNKIIFVVILLILSIQVISTIFQVFQIRSVFLHEFILGAQNLSQSPFFDLTKRMKSLLMGLEGQSITEENGAEINSSIELFISIIQPDQFGNILNSRDDLKELRFIDNKGNVITYSYKENGEVIHKNKNQAELTISDKILPVINTHKPGSATDGNNIMIFVPYFLQDTYFGGLVMTYSDDRVSEATNQIILISIGLLVIFMIISALVIVLFVTNVLTKPINRMIDLMKQLADGNFSQRFEIKIKDEVGVMGEAVNNLVDSLQTVLRDISDVMGGVEKGDLSKLITAELKGELDKIKSRINQSITMLSETISTVAQSSDSVQTSAKELSSSADVLSSSTAKQAATLEEISSSIAQIESHSKQNSKNSQEANDISKNTLGLVNRGTQQMEEMTSSMNQINNTSADITKIIKIIDEIAFQTNLLALNAAVEAARAGKYGKGFAVVAEEVRNLAARSAEAAKDTSNLIESSTKEVELGVENAQKTSTILSEIVSEVEKSSQLISLIAEASQEQSIGISEINSGISQVNDTVQQNSAISEETASASDLLLTQSNSLQQEISRFRLLGVSSGEYQPEIEMDDEDTPPMLTR